MVVAMSLTTALVSEDGRETLVNNAIHWSCAMAMECVMLMALVIVCLDGLETLVIHATACSGVGNTVHVLLTLAM